MPRPHLPAPPRAVALSLLATGALVGGLMSGTPATAADPDGGSRLTRIDRSTSFAGGRYVVVLREPAAGQYDGADLRSRASGTRREGQFDSTTAAARTYTERLLDSHRAVARAVGATVARHYTAALNGFAAELTARQASDLVGDRRVLLVEPDRRLKLDTWNTPDFLGLTGKRGAWARHGGRRSAGAGTVVGVLDTGIWPESRSFAGATLTTTPAGRWDIHRRGSRTFMDKADGTQFNGECMTGDQFTVADCNRKLIGARYYPDVFGAVENPSPEEYLSPRDGEGHGSHTAGTAAGKFGVRAVVEGRRFGRISGMAPAARIAAYKVCYTDTDEATGDCFTSAALAGINDAVADGVDVINYSISGSLDTVVDPVELAFEGAAEAGVFVATSAGNQGPTEATVGHPSPWLTSVAASTHARFENTLVLGNGRKIVGASIADAPVPPSPLVDSAQSADDGVSVEEATLCAPESLDEDAVAGAIVVCTRGVYDRVAKSAEVARAGGVAMVLANPSENSVDADFHSVPTVHLDVEAAARVFRYLETAGGNATASIRLGNLTRRTTPVPQVAGFSSRGPSLASNGDILKPDITAPGVSVLAAVAPPSNFERDFDLYSGTSMASPHIAGLAAFLSGQHPLWTPMQLKSAMMTTAGNLLDEDGSRVRDPFVQGAGHVRPRRMFRPGLFVTSTPRQWRGFITGQGLDTGVPALAARKLNLPSMALGQVVNRVSFVREFTAAERGVWRVRVNVPGFDATTNKSRLVMTGKRDVEDLRVTFTRDDAPLREFATGFVTLRGPTRVRIPVALRPVSVKAPSEVSGAGTSGSVEVDVTAGFTGDLRVEAHGLAKAQTASDTVVTADDPVTGQLENSHFYCVTTDATTQALRADLDSLEQDADLDLYGYVLQGDCNSPAVDYLAISAAPAADESFTVLDPPAGSYLLEVNGYADGADGNGSVGYVLDVYDVNAAAAAGAFHAEPNPVPVVARQRTTFRAVWSGLDPNSRYLGLLEYEGALNPTFVSVTTSTP